MARVSVIVGSKTDLPHVSKVGEVLKALGIEFVANVISAHRNSEELRQHCRAARGMGTQIFITAAGWAAALAGAVAAETQFMIPVIGIPLPGGPYQNDSLYAMASMPPGCPVLVAPNAENAAIAAGQILAIFDPVIREQLVMYLAKAAKKREPQFNVKLNNLQPAE